MRQKADVSIQEGGREDQSSEVTAVSLAVQRLLGYALVTKEQQAAHSSCLWPLPPRSCVSAERPGPRREAMWSEDESRSIWCSLTCTQTSLFLLVVQPWDLFIPIGCPSLGEFLCLPEPPTTSS